MLKFEITKEGLKISIENKECFLECCNLSMNNETGEYEHGEFVSTCDILEYCGLIGNGWECIEDQIACFGGEVICYDAYRDTEGNFINFGYDSFYDPFYDVSFWYERLANSKEGFIILPRLDYDNIEDELHNMKMKRTNDPLAKEAVYSLGVDCFI